MRRLALVLLSFGLLTACGAGSPAALPTIAATVAAKPTTPDWFSIPFTDARTGQPLTLASYSGKTVFVEGMAAWCTNCLNQQRQDVLARQQLTTLGADVTFISLDVDPSENATQLAQYAHDKGFDWTFALASKPLLDALINQFGRTITNPTSTPIFIIAPDGNVSELLTNGHAADDLVAHIKQQIAA